MLTLTMEESAGKEGSLERALGDQRMTILFHTQKGTVALPGLRGRENLVTRAPFPGRLGGYEAAVLMG